MSDLPPVEVAVEKQPDTLTTYQKHQATLRTIEECVAELADPLITASRIRGWIWQGLGGKRLPTYRRQGDGRTVCVIPREVFAFLTNGRRHAATRKATGRINLTFTPEQADVLRSLATALAKKLGTTEVCVKDAVTIATTNELIRLKTFGERINA
jgi:hypothetical protein